MFCVSSSGYHGLPTVCDCGSFWSYSLTFRPLLVAFEITSKILLYFTLFSSSTQAVGLFTAASLCSEEDEIGSDLGELHTDEALGVW